MVTVDFLTRVRSLFPDEIHRAYAIRDLWEYGPGVMPTKDGYGEIGKTIPSFRDCSQTHKHLMFIRGYILAEVSMDPEFPEEYDLDVIRTMLDLFLLLVHADKDNLIPAYFLEEGGISKMMIAARRLRIDLPASLAPRLTQIASVVGAIDSPDGKIAQAIREIGAGQYQLA